MKMANGLSLFDQLAKGFDPDPEVFGDVGLVDLPVADRRLDAFGNHRLVGDKQEGAGRDVVEEAHGEDGGGLHVDAHRPDPVQVALEVGVVFPDPSVGRVDGAGPVIPLVLPDGGGDGLLQGEGRQGGHLGREVVVGGASRRGWRRWAG